MAYIVRDPRFSMSMPVEPEHPTTSRYPRVSYAKQLERRIINLWKLVTRVSRKQPRNSFMSPDFVAITRRRSTFHPHLYRL